VRFSLSRLGVALTAAVLALAGPTSAATAQPTSPVEPAVGPASVHDLAVTATFGEPSYGTGEKMTITVTVENTAAEPLTVNAYFFARDPDAIRVDIANPFEMGTPFPLAAGESVTHTVTGAMGDPNLTAATLYALISDETGMGELFTFSVPVVPTVATVSGTVYYDKNRNRHFDDGEGQRGVTLTLANELHSGTTLTATTDAAGRFTMTGVPTGPYVVTGAGLGGLQVGWQELVVGESGLDGLLLRGVAPVSGLDVDVRFTKDVYAKDEAPVVRVTLTNTGDHVLGGIRASCDRAGMDNGLDGRGEGWGALPRAGVDIAPHSTVVLDVTEPMPAAAYERGFVTVGCEFRYAEVDSPFNPYGYDKARVPGRLGDLQGQVVDGATGIPGARVVLVAEDACVATAETTTGQDGRFAFRQVPVDRYQAYLFPPAGWHYPYDNPTGTDVIGGVTGDMYLELVRGDAPPPTLPACPAGGNAPTTGMPAGPAPQPAPRSRPAPVTALADTGVDLAVPVVTGLLALLAGTVLVAVTRRRDPVEER
jgi:hypothetical protein